VRTSCLSLLSSPTKSGPIIAIAKKQRGGGAAPPTAVRDEGAGPDFEHGVPSRTGEAARRISVMVSWSSHDSTIVMATEF
jgi:hypothetical protein